MSDPILPIPESEPAAPRRRKLSRKWIVTIVAVVVVAVGLGGAAYGVQVKGDAKASEYAKALDAWNDQKNDLLGAPAEANSGLWDFNDATTKKSVAKQNVACERVLKLRKSTAKNAAAVPKADDSFFKLLSSDQRDAIKESAAREKAVKAYATAADKVLVQLHKDCAWNIRSNSAKEGDSGAKKIFDKAEKLLLQPGQSAGIYYCPSSAKAACLPVTTADRTKYAELTLKGLKVDKAYVMKRFFAPGSCDATSYGDLCDEMKATLSSYYANIGDYNALFKTIDPSSSKLRQEFDRMVKNNKSADKAFKKALFKAYPEFKSDFRVSKYPFWQEAYFSASAVKSIRSLEKLRKTVLLGAGNTDSVQALGELSDVQLR